MQENIEENTKHIEMTEKNNKYIIKKTIQDFNKKTIKKRIVSEKWTFSTECYEYPYQFQVIEDIIHNQYTYKDEVSKTIMKEINKKISNYKQQDMLKKHLDHSNFLTFESVIHKMKECELNCRYCNRKMSILYDISREMCQWSVDRIDNDKGHNIDNFHLACLECNLKRRRRSDEKFLFTKQLILVKQDK
jgi:hypothetical protein